MQIKKIILTAGAATLWLFSVTAVFPESEALTQAINLQNAFHSVYESNKDSVVFISTEKTVKNEMSPLMNDPFFRHFFGDMPNQPSTRKETGLGTGFIISEDGYICTNHHVIDSMEKVIVRMGKKEFTARVIGSDAFTDIALLKIDNVRGLKPVQFGDSDSVRVGDWGIAIGNPFGLDRTLTVGVISAAAREDVDRLGNSHIQSDVSINRGNSGGPLLNIKGEVIGVNRMIFSPNGGSIGIGFSIPSNVAVSILEDLKKNGKVRRGYLGVQISPLSPERASEAGLKSTNGAYVESLQGGGPAEKGGLLPGDIILKINGTEIENPGNVVKLVSQQSSGSTLKMVIQRNRKPVELKIILGERPHGT